MRQLRYVVTLLVLIACCIVGCHHQANAAATRKAELDEWQAALAPKLEESHRLAIAAFRKSNFPIHAGQSLDEVRRVLPAVLSVRLADCEYPRKPGVSSTTRVTISDAQMKVLLEHDSVNRTSLIDPWIVEEKYNSQGTGYMALQNVVIDADFDFPEYVVDVSFRRGIVESVWVMPGDYHLYLPPPERVSGTGPYRGWYTWHLPASEIAADSDK